jgi:diacylglycerol kinase family enzyme
MRAPSRRARSNSQEDLPPTRARILAAGALSLLAALVALMCFATLGHPGNLIATVVAASIGLSAVWVMLTNRRWRGWAVLIAVVMIVGCIAALRAAHAGTSFVAVLLAGTVLGGSLGFIALREEAIHALRARWRDVAAARKPVLLMNPKSGGGKVQRFGLVDACSARGIRSVLLHPGDDLGVLARSAVEAGADAIGMAGGDGSQAIVAAVAAENGIPFVCVPAGTRNHFALDLGVERDDLVGALDAFGDSRETTIDLATVNGRVFVNNVSLGLYGSMVTQEDYRDRKLRTAAEVIQEQMDPKAEPFDLHLDSPEGPIDNPQVVQVSNNPYLLGSLTSFGTRDRMDRGLLGVVAVRVEGPDDLDRLLRAQVGRHPERSSGLQSWQVTELEVRSSFPVAAGVDGESCRLDPPIRFRVLPHALRVRVAHGHPGPSPAMRRAPLTSSTVVGLWSLVRGHPSGLVA